MNQDHLVELKALRNPTEERIRHGKTKKYQAQSNQEAESSNTTVNGISATPNADTRKLISTPDKLSDTKENRLDDIASGASETDNSVRTLIVTDGYRFDVCDLCNISVWTDLCWQGLTWKV
ncbi:hypothetical protein AMTR_s00104p00151370 [Amborella trichopoda]|uniref:Uncharacterized protein n=1 Tax=Amborella trichopoda TaxID=13333 RepID=W1NT32_AMBTC|nr:hypothetical protein AMTR_s00104p00151370 [Amborella trichopoda]